MPVSQNHTTGRDGLQQIGNKIEMLRKRVASSGNARTEVCNGKIARVRLPPMNDNHLSRREILLGTAAAFFLKGTPVTEAADSSNPICFMSTIEMARLIHEKKL